MRSLYIAAISTLLVFGCGGDDSAAPGGDTAGSGDSAQHEDGGAHHADVAPGEDEAVYAIPFVATVDGAALECGVAYEGIGLSDSTIQVRDFRFYAYDIHLLNAEGEATPLRLIPDGSFQLPYTKSDGSDGWLALIDFTDTGDEICGERGTADVNTVINGIAAQGDYTRVAFSLGVPPEINHVNGAQAEAPLNVYGMQWTWASGFRHVKIDVQATTGEKVKPWYYFHPGAQGCLSDDGTISGNYSCDNPLNGRVEMDFTFGSQAIEADLKRFYANNDLNMGRGCMFARTLDDIAGDGFGNSPSDGCPEMYAAFGLELSEVLEAVAEEMGTCADDPLADEAAVACSADTDCADGVACEGYVAAQEAIPATFIPQTIFDVVAHEGETDTTIEQPAVGELASDDPYGWPHPDYDRNEAFDVSAMSVGGESKSHPPGDLRYGANCMKCHQAHGPGLGQFVIGGTMYADDGSTYEGGGMIEVGTGVGNRFGPKTHPIADKIASWEKLFEVPIDANGQFYATADQATGIDYAQDNYYARIVGSTGWCKTPTGDVVGEDTCDTDDDCSALTYDIAGACMSATGEPMMQFGQPVTCATADDCGEADATCEGASTGHVPLCDKLRNAMAIAPHGACNHCHQTSFKIRENPHL